jgi:hypothetical protein
MSQITVLRRLLPALLVGVDCGAPAPKPPELPAAEQPQQAPREVRVGMTYAVRMLIDRLGQERNVFIDTTVTVASATPDEVLLDVQVHELSLRGASPLKIYDNVRRRVSVRLDDVMPLVKVLDPNSDDPFYDEAILNTTGVAYCVLPDRPHKVGNTRDARTGIPWDVRPPVVHDGVTLAVYHYRMPLKNPATFGLEVMQELRLDDGFAGTCDVDHIYRAEDGSERREGAYITATRVR